MKKPDTHMSDGVRGQIGSFRRHPVLAWLRTVLVCLIALNAAAAVWLIVEFDGQYTEGVPAPARIHALAGIDDQNTLIDISIENSSRFFVYQLIRDDVEPENGSEDSDDETTNEAPADEEETDEESVSQLDQARNWIKLSIGLLILIELLVAFVGINPWFRTIGFLAVLVAFIIILPLSFIGDNPNFANPGESPNSEVKDDDEEGGSDFVHEEVGFDLGLRLGGFEVSMFYSGYDLGLVDEENRSEVRENPPEEGTRDAASFVKLDSSLSIRYGPAVVLLAILPILWIISPSGGSFQPNNDEAE
ncbi:MAG: hypothetical protein DBX05_02300 [Candidatus Poseidoniales archaeon]|nr:MAG: hypothetical protein DBX05_07075 [Candidatus Poseidoniales archaeon]RCH74209.1 MAG: hypothetical protein DBX05_02300 [Candidatus Poseidoniales archaeon]CAI8195269.1 MAG: Uncharacterised protein [Euryarchaeota archaeon]